MPPKDNHTKINELLEAHELGKCRLTEWERDRLNEWAERDTLTDRQSEIVGEVYRDRLAEKA